jgi:hypothetical protein
MTGKGGLTTMQYLLLIYGNESQFGKMSEAEHGKIRQEYTDFTKSIAGSGHYKGGNELDHTSTATTIRVRDGKRLVGARIPSARWGSIEVRPIIVHPMP